MFKYLDHTKNRTHTWFSKLESLLQEADVTLWYLIDGIDEVKTMGIEDSSCNSKEFEKVVRSLKPLLDVAAKNTFIKTKLFLLDCMDTLIFSVLPDWRKDKVPLI